jgi:hypothetical protein
MMLSEIICLVRQAGLPMDDGLHMCDAVAIQLKRMSMALD